MANTEHVALLQGNGVDAWNQWRAAHPETIPDLRNADLRSANLQLADLRNADLRSANLQHAALWDANLQGADLRSANLQHAALQNADLQNADLQNADLKHAGLRHADLRNADLRSAKLWYAHLQHADLRNADLRNAELRNAELWSANLQHADLRNADLRKAVLLHGSQLAKASFLPERKDTHFSPEEWSEIVALHETLLERREFLSTLPRRSPPPEESRPAYKRLKDGERTALEAKLKAAWEEFTGPDSAYLTIGDPGGAEPEMRQKALMEYMDSTTKEYQTRLNQILTSYGHDPINGTDADYSTNTPEQSHAARLRVEARHQRGL